MSISLIIRKTRHLARVLYQRERGVSLVEVIVALVIVATAGVAFIMALSTSFQATIIHDVHADADALAKSQIEFIKSMAYSSSNWSYTLAYGETPTGIPDEWDSEPELGEEYKSFTVESQAEDIDIDNDSTDEDGIRKITVRIFHPQYGADAVVTLEDYKRL